MSAFDFQPDTQQSVPEVPPPQGRIGPFTLGIIIASVVLIGIWGGWEPVSEALRSWRAHRSATEVHASVAAQDWANAWRVLAEARRRAPEDVEVISATIAFFKATRSDPAGLAQQLRLLEKKRALNDDEMLLLGRSLIATGKTAEARQIHDKLPLSVSTRPAGLQLLSEVLAAEGHAKEARLMDDRAAASADPATDPQAALKLSQKEQASAFPEMREKGRDRLWDLAAGTDAAALDAITTLVADETALPEATRLLTLVEKHPLATLPARLQVISALARLQPAQSAAIYRREVDRFQSEGSGRLEEIAFWLMQQRQHALVYELVPAKLALKSQELYPILMQTLGQDGRWQDLKSLLTAPSPPVPRSLVDLALVEVQSHIAPDMREARRLLEGTVKAAATEGSVATLQTAAELAARLNMPDITANAYLHAGLKSASGATVEEAVRCLQKSAEAALLAKDTTILLSAARRLQELSPGSAAYADRLTYLRLILGVEMETVSLPAQADASALRAMFTVAVERVPPSLLQALAAYRLGDLEGAKKHLSALPNASTLPAGQRAVAAGLLALAGKPDRAWQIAEKVPASLLLNEELAFLKHAR